MHKLFLTALQKFSSVFLCAALIGGIAVFAPVQAQASSHACTICGLTSNCLACCVCYGGSDEFCLLFCQPLRSEEETTSMSEEETTSMSEEEILACREDIPAADDEAPSGEPAPERVSSEFNHLVAGKL